ncbi:DgyrCDS6400 [Dimorphilus gyrociliatus]|uniref:DgyrCDS6400 n=1 Tax=Dimorphilus gyrociliatus TaxID=2664684 RepID=A0A7I8VPK3_9ANNE|nr:DgyrCDS6400 [Dimorphilus gyrociliatus]
MFFEIMPKARVAAEFKKLADQVRSVHNDLNVNNAKYRGSGFKCPQIFEWARLSSIDYRYQAIECLIYYKLAQKFYQNDDGQDVPVIYRTQLASSLKAFQSKVWLPYDSDTTSMTPSSCKRDPDAICSRSRNSFRPSTKPRFSYRPSTTSATSRPLRERSTALPSPLTTSGAVDADDSLSSCSEEDIVGEFDKLTPEAMFELVDCIQPQSYYSQRAQSSCKRFTDNRAEQDESHSEVDVKPTAMEKVVRVKRRDFSKYSLDSHATRAEKKKELYKFPDPLSEGACSIDLSRLASLPVNEIPWSKLNIRPVDEVEEKLMNRLLALQKLTIKTTQIENARRERARASRQRAVTSQLTKLRLGISPAVRPTSSGKKCCDQCLQPACVGDCRTCATPSPIEQTNNTYKSRPKSCTSLRSENSAKSWNQRPKSSLGRVQSKQTPVISLSIDVRADKRPISAAMPKRKRARGRAAFVVGGRHFHSQRHHSISDSGSKVLNRPATATL